MGRGRTYQHTQRTGGPPDSSSERTEGVMAGTCFWTWPGGCSNGPLERPKSAVPVYTVPKLRPGCARVLTLGRGVADVPVAGPRRAAKALCSFNPSILLIYRERARRQCRRAQPGSAAYTLRKWLDLTSRELASGSRRAQGPPAREPA